jgi:YHS domain-containing protein
VSATRVELEAIIAGGCRDSFDAFSQIHLATAAERAVYRCFASDPHACWSDAEIAFAAHRDISEASWTLERFANAGIVEVVEDGCYRWRPGLRYVLERAEPQTEDRDPVCWMPVTVDATYRAQDVFGRTERFCSERCMAAFLVWPLVFTRRPGAEVDRSRVQDDHGP